jgi:CheY-like chemotaxis protein
MLTFFVDASNFEALNLSMIPQTGTILCVESEDPARESRCNALAMAGYTAVRASTKKAIAVLSESAFDLIVTSGLIERRRSIKTLPRPRSLMPLAITQTRPLVVT